MKNFFIIIFLTLLFIPVSVNAAETENSWILLDSDDRVSLFFDSAAITADACQNIITVFLKWQYSPASAAERVEKYGLDKEIYLNYSYDLYLVKFDIKNKKSAIMSRTEYSADGKALNTYKYENWKDILPNTHGELVFEKITAYYLENQNHPDQLYR